MDFLPDPQHVVNKFNFEGAIDIELDACYKVIQFAYERVQTQSTRLVDCFILLSDIESCFIRTVQFQLPTG